MAYLGGGNYAQLILHMTTYEYEIFGLGSPINIDVVETKPLIIGTFMVDEDNMLAQLLETGLDTPKPSTSGVTHHMGSASVSASTRTV